MKELDHFRRKADKMLEGRRQAVLAVQAERKSLEAMEARLADALEAQGIVQAVAALVQQQAHSRIAGVVSRCLRAVFGPQAPSFEIKFEQKRGRTEARLVFVKNGNEMDPEGSSGGGAIDVAAFALRLAALVLTRPRPRRLLILDEPMKWVNGDEAQARVGDLLKCLAEEFHVQIIMVTDDDWLKVGRVVEL
jgi:DNA repair exonuclease SbcCD ATPase subunit